MSILEKGNILVPVEIKKQLLKWRHIIIMTLFRLTFLQYQLLGLQ